MIYQTSDFRNGLKVEIDRQPYIMVYFQFVKPGKGQAFVRTKIKNLLLGTVIEKTFKSGVKVDQADVEECSSEYLYNDNEVYVFMNQQNYEQIEIALLLNPL